MTTGPRTIKNALFGLLEGVTAAVYVVDDKRRIVYCNRACADWINLPPEHLVGRQCRYHSGVDPTGDDGATAGLCPPPETFDGQPATAVVGCRLDSAAPSYRRAAMQPLGDDPVDCAGVLVVVGGEEVEPQANPVAAADVTAEALHEALMRFRARQAHRFCAARLVGDSPAMRQVRQQVGLLTAQRADAVIVGPPGSGRQHVARVVHHGSDPSPETSLTPLRCELLDIELVQTTVAALLRRDADHAAAGSTLLLLEIERLPSDAQWELSRLLQAGASRLRVLATARASLFQAVGRDEFRADLAHRLSTVEIQLPPLSQRPEDIPLLAQLLLEEENAESQRQLGGFTPEALDRLATQPWQENVDELAAVVREAHRLADGPLVTVVDLPDRIRLATEAAAHPRRDETPIVLDELLAQVEAELIQRAMRRAQGNKTKAAQLLGITRARLHRKLADGA